MGIELGAKNLYKAYGVPALDLTFADKKSLVDRISGNNLITFTRSSTATYVGADGLIKSAAVNEPRFDHTPSTGESLGLLVEEARTNLLTYSEQFDNAAWAKAQTTITANAAIAPDGSTTADALIENTATSYHEMRTDNFSGSINTAYSFSVFAKAAGRTFVTLSYGQSTAWGSQWARFNLTSGTVVFQIGINSARIKAYSNGWYQISITGTRNAVVAATYAYIGVQNGDNYDSHTGDGTSGIYLWGAQLEAGAFPTSYIPTVAATVTRAADVASITGANFSSWYRQDEGTLLAIANAYNANAVSTGGYNSSVWGLSVNPGSNTTYASLWRSASNNNGEIFVRQSNTTQALLQPISPIAASAQFKQITTLKQDAFASSNNGSSVAIDTLGALPSFDQLIIGGNFIGGSGAWNSTIARLTYYPVRLPDAQLQALTAT